MHNGDSGKGAFEAMKKWISLLLVSVLLLTCSGCIPVYYGNRDIAPASGYSTYSRVTLPTMPTGTYGTPASTTADTTRYSYTATTRYTASSDTTRYTVPPYTTRSTKTTTAAKPTAKTTAKLTTKPSSSHTRFTSLTALRDYMNAQKDSHILKFSFEYTGNTLSAQTVAQMTNACYINLNQTGTVYTVTVTEYPGDRIVDAYVSGDSSKLTSDERAAMNKAVQMVNQAKAQTSNTFELEVLLHDMLCNQITYHNDNNNFNDPNRVPRNLTVIGALLDGKANCQGYTDAFYTLASIAGFKVSRMSTYSPDDLHMTNTVYLNNAWYVVDVTYDDDDNGERNYRLFNAGVDMIREYTWDAEKEVHPIAKTSGVAYYYHYTDSVYTSMQTMVNDIAAGWSSGSTTIRAMLRNNTDGDAMNALLKSVLDQTGKPYSYTYWYYENDRDTFYTVKFK